MINLVIQVLECNYILIPTVYFEKKIISEITFAFLVKLCEKRWLW